MTASPTAVPMYTPAPWVVGYKAFDVTACDGRMKICDIRGWGYLTGKGEALGLSDEEGIEIQTANAHLIASAPAMYEALELALPELRAAALAEKRRNSAPVPHKKTIAQERLAAAEAALRLARGEG